MKLLIMSVCYFPNGDANAVRQYALAKLFEKCGYKVTLIGLTNNSDSNNIFKSSYYEGIEYYLYSGSKRNFKKYIQKFFDNIENDFNGILLNGIPINAFIYVKKFALKNNIQLYHDCVEWYSKEEFTKGFFSRTYIEKDIMNRFLLDKNFKVISISTYLDDYFHKKGILSLRIPVIMDIKNMQLQKLNNNEKLVITYAGSPAKKDYLKEIVKGFIKLSKEEKEKLIFNIIGVDSQELLKLVEISTKELADNAHIRIFGRVERTAVISILKKSDFTILIRPENLRYTKAGFPTKVVESLACSTPVILNFTSDLEMYLSDTVNCITVNNSTSDAIVKSLKRTLTISSDEKAKMFKNAREISEKNFDYRIYYKQFYDFINK